MTMAGLVLFTDNILYICKLKNIFVNGKLCSVKYHDNKKYAACVLAVCNNEIVLKRLQSNLDGELDEVGEDWTCVDWTERSYAKVSRDITKTNDESILFIEENIVTEKWGRCMSRSLCSLTQDLNVFFRKPARFLQWKINKVHKTESNNVSKPKLTRKRRQFSEYSEDNKGSENFKPKAKYSRNNEYYPMNETVNLEHIPSHKQKNLSLCIAALDNTSGDLINCEELTSKVSDIGKEPSFPTLLQNSNYPMDQDKLIALISGFETAQIPIESLVYPHDDPTDNSGLKSNVPQLEEGHHILEEALPITSSLNCCSDDSMMNQGMEPKMLEVKDLKPIQTDNSFSKPMDHLEIKSQISQVEEAVLTDSFCRSCDDLVESKYLKCRKRLDFIEPASSGSSTAQSVASSIITEIQSKPTATLEISQQKEPLSSTGPLSSSCDGVTEIKHPKCMKRLYFHGSDFDGSCASQSGANSINEEIKLKTAPFKCDEKLKIVSARAELSTAATFVEVISVEKEVTDLDGQLRMRAAQAGELEKSASAATSLEKSPNNPVDNHKLESPILLHEEKPIVSAPYMTVHEQKPEVQRDEVPVPTPVLPYSFDNLEDDLKATGILRVDNKIKISPVSTKVILNETFTVKLKDVTDYSSLELAPETAETGKQHPDISLNQNIVHELNNSSIEKKNFVNGSIISETDGEDTNSVTDTLHHLRIKFEKGKISPVPAQARPAIDENISQVPAEENLFHENLIEKLSEYNITVTESLLNGLIENYDSKSVVGKLDDGIDKNLLINDKLENYDINPFQNNVAINHEYAGIHEINTTIVKKKKEQIPLVISDEPVKISYRILRKSRKLSTGEYSQNCNDGNNFNVNSLEDFEAPQLHSTACEAEDTSIDTRSHFKDVDPEESSKNGDSSDNYEPNEDENSRSDSDDCQEIEDAHEVEYEPPEPLNITHGDNGPTSAPDDKDLRVEASSAGLKKHFCFYCFKFQTKLARHLMLVHKKEEDVRKFMVLPAGSRERKEIIAVIRKNGDFLFNSDRRFNNGVLIVCRRPNEKMKVSAEDFMVCGKCKAQYRRSSLRNHFRGCAEHDGKKQRVILVKGRKIAARVHARASKDVRTKIFPYLREDAVVKSIRYDELVTLYANKMCEKHGTHQHLFQMIRAKLRLLGRFLISIKSIENRIQNFSDVFQPRFYDATIKAVRVIAQYDSEKKIFGAPAVASGYGTLLKRIGEILRSECIKKELALEQRRVEDFLKLIAEDYGTSINRVVTETQTQNNRRKEVILPTTDDVRKLHEYVKAERDECYSQLSKNFSYATWENLAKMSLLSLQIFNRRRPGEIERIYIEDFQSHRGLDHATASEAYHALSDEGKKLARKYHRFEIRGKLGRGVPVLIDTDLLDCLNLLIDYRKDAGVPDKNCYLFGLPSRDNDRHRHLHACDLMREFSVKCGADIPETLRGTTLRKHIATKCINLNLTEGQVADLANFMGHAEKIHRDIYRQPVLETDIVKISKLLNKAQGFEPSDDECDADDDNECIIPVKKYSKSGNDTGNSRDPSSSFRGVADESLSISSKNVSTIKQQWTTAEKTTALSAFEKHLLAGKVPSGKELQHFIDTNQCLKGRTVPQFRTWLHTQKKKLSKV